MRQTELKRRTPLKRSEWARRKEPIAAKLPDGPARGGENVECAVCGELFYATPHDVRRGARYCSNACNGKAQRVREDRRCRICRATFTVKPSSKRKTCGRTCANEAKRQAKLADRNPNYLGDEAAAIRWRSQAAEACVVCGSDYRPQLHHVVYAQHVRDKKGDPWNPADSLTLCNGCHCRHHAAPNWKLPLSYLRDENYAFAFDLMGPAAYDYLRRRYDGEDPRLDALLERAAA